MKEGMKYKNERGKKAYHRGHLIEKWVGCWLSLKGYRWLACNQQTPFGELDLIMQKRKQIILIEVKSRQSLHEAMHALNHFQLMRLQKGFEWWMQNGYNDMHDGQNMPLRIDYMAVNRWGYMHHIKNISH